MSREHDEWVKRHLGADPQRYALTDPDPDLAGSNGAAPANAQAEVSPAGGSESPLAQPLEGGADRTDDGGAAPAPSLANAPAEGSPAGGAESPQSPPSAEGADSFSSGPGASLVNNEQFKRLVEAMEADGDAADAQWKSQNGDGVFDYLSPEQKPAYNRDQTQCAEAQGNFNAEWNKIVFNKGGDPAKLLQAYDIFSLRIGALQRSNERVEALIELDLGVRFVVFFTFLRQWSQTYMTNELKERLAQLAKHLAEAEHEVTKAKVKTALNAAASIITLIAAPEAVLGKVALSVGAVAFHIAVDQSLGEGSTLGTVVFVAGDSKDVIELSKTGEEALKKMKIGGKRLGAAGLVITGFLDVKEIYEGKEKLDKIAKEIEVVEQTLDNVINETGQLPLQLVMLDAALQALRAELPKALARGNDAAKNYDATKVEIEKVLKGG